MIEIGKKYKTRDGRDVRVLAVDLKGVAPVVAVVPCDGGKYERALSYTSEGAAFPFCENSNDLIEVKPEHTAWVNMYADGFHCGHNTQDGANAASTGNRIACVKITFRPGDGL